MALITWGPQYALDVHVIDEEHQKLIGYMNELHEAMAAGKSHDVLGGILHKLEDYTKTHFSDEEKYMRTFQYQEYVLHKGQHDSFVRKIADFRAQFESGQASVSLELLHFLRDWLVHHIQGTDKRYVECFHQHGLK